MCGSQRKPFSWENFDYIIFYYLLNYSLYVISQNTTSSELNYVGFSACISATEYSILLHLITIWRSWTV